MDETRHVAERGAYPRPIMKLLSASLSLLALAGLSSLACSQGPDAKTTKKMSTSNSGHVPLPADSQPSLASAYFAGGCFWGVEDVFRQVDGVTDAVSGYMGGQVANPTYKQVCSDTTGHAETVKVVFDPARVDYRQLLKVFFDNHDPTTLDRQGPDIGSSYRSAIFAATPEQEKAAEAFVQELSKAPRFTGRKIVTQIVAPGPQFWAAEEYHQDYHEKHGGSCKVKVF